VGVADRVKTTAAQSSDDSFSGIRKNDILTAALETPIDTIFWKHRSKG
jgi:hypothetical protein